MIHTLKTHPRPFRDVIEGRKTFEFRREDTRQFAVGDTLDLREWDPDCSIHGAGCDLRDDMCGAKGHTGRMYLVDVTYVLREGFGIPSGYCIMSIKPVPAF